jgi:hypothetical protein
LPPPASNAPSPLRREIPPDAGPDALDTPAYVAPTAPPAETEHKTFELQTVKVAREAYETDVVAHQDPRSSFAQLDIPTAPSTMVVQRRRARLVLVGLAALGLLTGAALIAAAFRASEPRKQPAPSATVGVHPVADPMAPASKPPRPPAAK